MVIKIEKKKKVMRYVVLRMIKIYNMTYTIYIELFVTKTYDCLID